MTVNVPMNTISFFGKTKAPTEIDEFQGLVGLVYFDFVGGLDSSI